MPDPAPRDRRILLALAVSLALHLAALFLSPARPEQGVRKGVTLPPSRFDVTLARPAAKVAPPQPQPQPNAGRPQPAAKPAPHPPPQVASAEPTPHWTRREKDEMNRFLDDLAAEAAKPRSGLDLAEGAIAAARTLAVPPRPAPPPSQEEVGADIEPISLQMYFDALFRKLNRTAPMVARREGGNRGVHVAAVRVALNADGSLKTIEVLNASDQQAEVAYVAAVFKQAAPFPAFPPDIRRATDSLNLQICIQPGRGGGGGAVFSPMSGECRD